MKHAAKINFLYSRLRSGPLAFLFTSTFLFLLGLSAAKATSTPASSGYVFRGTVVKLHASTEGIPLEPRTAVVRVDEVLSGTEGVGNFKGQEVTLRLLPKEKVKEGDSLVFSTSPYTYRKTAGFTELSSHPASQSALLTQQIARDKITLQDRSTQKRLVDADLVVVGTVGETTMAKGVPAPQEEHDPVWFQAPVRVESVEKGKSDLTVLTVYFARNNDSHWAKAPKLSQGERALFLLHTDKAQAFGLKGYFVVDPSDVRPLEERDRVHALILKLKP